MSMPYSDPVRVSEISPGRRPTRVPGGAASLSPLRIPRRTYVPQKAVFHFREDDDTDSSSEDVPVTPPPSPNNSESLRLSLHIPCCELGSIPFPSSPTSTASTCPSPIFSNGKPLKPSLKCSLARDAPFVSHLRVQSAPLPSLKNVHFAEEKDKLESVCVFRRSARPASLCSPHEDTETEAEDENGISPDSFPLTNTRFTRTTFYLDHTTSPIPSLFSSPDANIYFESIALSSPDSMPVLTGFVVVRNIAYEKRVAARFTMDSWQTTSEVVMRHVVSLPSIPPAIIIGCAGRDRRRDGWDRFTFTIRLEDHVFTLQEKVMWLVVMYSTASGEWWDNNEGHNYRVGFQAGSQSARRRAVSLSAPANLSVATLITPNIFPYHVKPSLSKITPAVASRTHPSRSSIGLNPNRSVPTYGRGQQEAYRKMGGMLHWSRRAGAGTGGSQHTLSSSYTPDKESEMEMEFYKNSIVGSQGKAAPFDSGWSSSPSCFSVSALTLSDPASASASASDLSSSSSFLSSSSSGVECTRQYSALPVPSLSSSPYASHPQPLPSPRASPAFASTPMLMPAQTVLASNPPIPSSLRREEQQNRAGLNSVYKAFVKQWCFEEGSLASEASVGLI